MGHVRQGVALPEWIFSQDRRAAPWILIALVFFCILLPLVGAALFLLRTNKFVGSNQVAQQTIEIFARCGGCGTGMPDAPEGFLKVP